MDATLVSWVVFSEGFCWTMMIYLTQAPSRVRKRQPSGLVAFRE